MYRIIDERSTGKTSRLMLLAKENNGTIVCSNPHAMLHKAHAYGLTGIDFISYSQFLMEGRGFDLGKYYIDELEAFLRYVQQFVGVQGSLDGYTLSKED